MRDGLGGGGNFGGDDNENNDNGNCEILINCPLESVMLYNIPNYQLM